MRPLYLILAVLASFVIASASHAIERPFPANATFGKFSPSAFSATGAIVIDGKSYALSAGTQIRDWHNRIIFPKSLSGPDVAILYQKSHEGQIQRIWILTNDEAKKYAPATPATPPVPPAPPPPASASSPAIPPIPPTTPAIPDRTAKGLDGSGQPLQPK